MTLLSKLHKAGAIKHAHILDESPFLKERDLIPTDIPLLNIAFSGNPKGGFSSGLGILAGERATFKTRIGLELLKAYLNKYPDGVGLFYDSEGGASLAYLEECGIDRSRILHLPIAHIEELKFDISKKLEAIERGEHVMIFVDSIGMLASRKEIDDALDEKSVADMTRAKALRSLFRIMTPHLMIKNIPALIIAHTYNTMDMFSKAVVGGGTAPMYAANEVFIITKSRDRDPTTKEVEGYNFTMKVEKSRTLREETKLPIYVDTEHGVLRNSGLFEIALEAGIVTSPSKGWYCIPGSEKKLRKDDLIWDDPTWDAIIIMPEFQNYIRKSYCLVK